MENNIDKNIERCKELIKTEHANWIGLTNQDAIAGVLSEFQWLREFSVETVRNNVELQVELETYKKIVDKIEERKKWLEDNILDNDYASDNDKDKAEYQVNILEEIIDWARKEVEK